MDFKNINKNTRTFIENCCLIPFSYKNMIKVVELFLFYSNTKIRIGVSLSFLFYYFILAEIDIRTIMLIVRRCACGEVEMSRNKFTGYLTHFRLGDTTATSLDAIAAGTGKAVRRLCRTISSIK